jgi:uncharacterized protein
MSDALRTVIVDGLSVSTTDQGAQAITTLLQRIADAATKATQTETAHVAAIAAKDTEIGTLKAELKTAKDAALKPADIDRLVADRSALVGAVKAIDPKIVTDGKTDAEMRREAVRVKLGDEMIKDASDDQITGMFKAIAKDAKVDPVANALRDQRPHQVNTTDADKARQEAEASQANAWKTKAA